MDKLLVVVSLVVLVHVGEYHLPHSILNINRHFI